MWTLLTAKEVILLKERMQVWENSYVSLPQEFTLNFLMQTPVPHPLSLTQQALPPSLI
jgi:hypothetical protein